VSAALPAAQRSHSPPVSAGRAATVAAGARPAPHVAGDTLRRRQSSAATRESIVF